MKPWLHSKTILGGLLTGVLSVGVVVAGPGTSIYCRLEGEDSVGCKNLQDVAAMVLGLAGLAGVGAGSLVVKGRVDRGDVYTPEGLPGPNEADLVENYLDQIADVKRTFDDIVPGITVTRRIFGELNKSC